MKRLSTLFLVCAGLSACTSLRPEKAPVGGSVWLLSQADLHAAVASARSARPDFIQAPVESMIVDSRSKVYIYFVESDYPHGAIVERINGHWQYVAAIARVITC